MERREVLLFLAIPFGSTGCSVASCSSPERELRVSFGTRFVTLERIRAMAAEDKSVVRIAPTFTYLANDASWPRSPDKLGFSEARWNEYKRAFVEVGAPDGITQLEGVLYVSTKACGLSISGKEFGYAFLSEPPAAPVQTLEPFAHKGKGFVPLSASWYMYVWAT